METVLSDASREWATRSKDERFSSLSRMFLTTWNYAENSSTTDVNPDVLSVSVKDNDLMLKSPAGSMRLGHFAFGQLMTRIGCPTTWLRSLANSNIELVAKNINQGLEMAARNSDGKNTIQLYSRRDPSTDTEKLLAITTPKYGRIQSHQIVKSVIDMQGDVLKGWRTPPAMPAVKGQPTRKATAYDVGPWTNISLGQEIIDSGLYASDKDCFIFLLDPEHRINDGSDGGMSRGFWISNSEIGDANFTVTKFLFRYVCMNNNVWGANSIQYIKVKHLGKNTWDRAFKAMAKELKEYAESSPADEEMQIRRAKETILGNNLEDVQDLVFAQKNILPKRTVADAYEVGTQFADIDGDPNTVWGFGNAVTRLSQRNIDYTDDRADLDIAAASIFELATPGAL